MDPEKRLLVILEYLAIELKILFLGTIRRSFCPKRIGIVDKLGALPDL